MIDEKKCAKCKKVLPVEEFAWMETDDGRKRRKATCEPCLSNQREKAERTTDHRNYKHELEGVFKEWRSIACSAMSLDSTPATESSREV